MDCKSGFANKTISNMYFVRHRCVVGALETAKIPTFGHNDGQKHNLDLFATLRAPTTYLFHTKYVFGT